MPPQTLRPYQADGLARILDAYKQGARSVLAVLPTAGGKTTLFSALASSIVASGSRALLLVHRRELATQAANRFHEFGTDFGYIMAGEPTKPYARMQIASVLTLVRRSVPQASLIICDEAHLSTAKTWTSILDKYPSARILGVTATPWRLSGKPLVGSYDASVLISTPAELRQQGYLSDYVGFSYLTPDLSGVKTTAGEYNEHDSAVAMSQSLIVDSIVEEYIKHARHLSAVCFAVTVEHSKGLTARFKAAGVAAEHLDGKTGHEERKAILKRVESGATMVLCNVGVAVEGLDIPRLKCCILARPTKSLARAIQMMGRVRRPWNGVVARLHDHAFVIGTPGHPSHGLPDAERDYTLNAAPPKTVCDVPSLTQCEQCFALYQGPRCPGCSAENPVSERTLNTVADAEKVEFSSGDVAAVQEDRKPVDVRWTGTGRVVEGTLIKRWDEQATWGKMQRRYLVRCKKGDYSLPGTSQLDAKMAKVAIGDLIRVTELESTSLSGGRIRREFNVAKDDRRGL